MSTIGPTLKLPVTSDATPFDGFPYLVTRIGRTPLRHIALLPQGLSRKDLLDLAHHQAHANQLDTCLCLGPGDAVYVTAEGRESPETVLPWGVPVAGALRTRVVAEDTPELADRRARLHAFVGRHGGKGYIVGDGLESGRPASEVEVARLSGRGSEGAPKGLERCPACGSFRGECLGPDAQRGGDAPPEIVRVPCRCDNHNLCARCGGTLADRRLSAHYYDEGARKILYVAAYVAFSHRCPPASGDSAGEPPTKGVRG